MNFPLFETIAILGGMPQNLILHQQRYQNSLSDYYPNQRCQPLNLANVILSAWNKFSENNHADTANPLFRCRIDYNTTHYQIGFFPYTKKSYSHFQPVVCDSIDYHLKFANRDIFAKLLQQKGDADEVMIIKNGYVTDCTLGNLIFKKQGEWFTPNTPLLQGTQRAKLLDEQKISERIIRWQDIDNYEEIRLINAMNSL